MSGLLKVLDGTPKGDAPFLCKSCRHATRIRGAEGQESIKCSTLDEYIDYKVIECNEYNNKKDPSLIAMESIAWIVVTKGNRITGFERLIDRIKSGKDQHTYE